jgi:hypothetical protein
MGFFMTNKTRMGSLAGMEAATHRQDWHGLPNKSGDWQ